jgi:predicted nucleotidyltransferase
VSVGSLQSRLSELLDVKVDLSAAEWMREPVRSMAIKEAVLAF